MMRRRTTFALLSLLATFAAHASCVDRGSGNCLDRFDCLAVADLDAGSGAPPVSLSADAVVVKPGDIATVIVRLKDPTSSDVTLHTQNLPAGVTAEPVTVLAGTTSASLVFRASSDAIQVSKVITIDTATPKLGTTPLTVLVRGPTCSLDTTWTPGGVISSAAPDGGAALRGAAFDGDRIVLLGATTVARVKDDLTPDLSFNGGAPVHIDFGAGAREFVAAAVQADQLLLAGYNVSPSGADRGLVARLNKDGSLDSTFAGGKIEFQYPGVPAEIGSRALAIRQQSDGNVLVGGYIAAASGGTPNAVIARLRPAGEFDATFGDEGMLLFGSGAPEGPGVFSNVLTVAAGILGVGYFEQKVGSDLVPLWGTAGVTSAGALNKGYGYNGFYLRGAGDRDASRSRGIEAVFQEKNDSLLVASGGVLQGQGIFAASRVTAGGERDSTFHGGELLTIPLGAATTGVASVLADLEGRAVLVGTSSVGGLTVIRLTPDGKLDDTCGPQGKFGTNLGLTSVSPSIARIDALGRLVVVGTSSTSAWTARVWL